MNLTLQELDYLDEILAGRENSIRSAKDDSNITELEKALAEIETQDNGLAQFMKLTMETKLRDLKDYIAHEPEKLFRLRAKLLTIKDELILSEATKNLPLNK